jgi:EmrB/QacA subfamily drug resistance transporter
VVGALGLGAYLSALDSSIVNAVLPVIAQSFGTDVTTIEWVVTSYLLVQSALMLSVGRLGDMWGHKNIYILGLAIFVCSSTLCALATTTPMLVAGRALQGVGASMVFTNVIAIMTRVFPESERGKAVGIQSSIVYIGLATGAPLGGWLTGTFGWNSVFQLNVPLGLLALVLGWRLTPADAPARGREPFDLFGATVYIPGVALLLLGLNQGHAWGWTSAFTLACLAIGAAILAGWVAIELRLQSPIVDLRLFKQRSFSTPLLSALLNYLAVASSFVLPFAFIQGHGLSPAAAGTLLICQPIAMAVTASISGRLSDRVGTRGPATVGMLVIALGLLLLSRQAASTPVWSVAAALLVTGVGIGLFTSPNGSALLGSVPQARRGVANGLLGTARTLGMLLGVGLAGAVYATTLSTTTATGADAILAAADAALLAASGVALVGAAVSASSAADMRVSQPRSTTGKRTTGTEESVTP